MVTRIVVSVLGVLGALVLLSQVLLEFQRPRRWKAINEKRRAFIIAMGSLVLGAPAGIIGFFKERANKRRFSLLCDIEVKAMQIEGLIISGLAGDLRSAEEINYHDRVRYLSMYADDLKESVRFFIKDAGDFLFGDPRTQFTLQLGVKVEEMNRSLKNAKMTPAQSRPELFNNLLREIGKVRSDIKAEKTEYFPFE